MTSTTHPRLDEAAKARARELRQMQTPAERRLWARLRGEQLAGYKFRRQHPIGPYILDFYCSAARLAIEIDGDTHVERAAYDAARTEWLQHRGCAVIRFTNHEVFESLEAVLQEIVDRCDERCEKVVEPTLPSP